MQLYIGTYLYFRLIWSNKFQAFKEIVQRKKKKIKIKIRTLIALLTSKHSTHSKIWQFVIEGV